MIVSLPSNNLFSHYIPSMAEYMSLYTSTVHRRSLSDMYAEFH